MPSKILATEMAFRRTVSQTNVYDTRPILRMHPARLLAVSVQWTFGLVLAVAFVG